MFIVGTIDGSSAYFGAGTSPEGANDQIVSVPLAGGSETVLFTGKIPRFDTAFSRLVVDSNFVYFPTDSEVLAVPKKGGVAQRFAAFGATSLHTGNDGVYLAPSNAQRELVLVPKLAP